MYPSEKPRLSPALQKERERLLRNVKNLVCDDIRAYVTVDNVQSSGWAVLLCKSLNCIMNMSFNNIYGLSLSFDIRPCRSCGTGFSCIEQGLASITRDDFYNACRVGWSKFQREPEASCYTGLSEYFANHTYASFVEVKPDAPAEKEEAHG